MSDCFLATVISFAGGEGQIQPLIVEADGTDHPMVRAKSVEGITPDPGDKVLVMTSRNNLDNSTISRFFNASESNCRIVGIVSKAGNYFVLTGNYRFVGDILVQGNVQTTGDIQAAGNIQTLGDVTAVGNVDVGGSGTIAGSLTIVTGLSVAGINVLTHGHISAAPGVRTGNMIP
jgi:hypothetical protein